MVRSKQSSLLFFLSISFFFIYPLFAGVTGKIAGTVTDKGSGESLAGVNIFLVGQPIGAATDIDGNYTILNIPPGKYELTISMIGFAEQTIKDVRVTSDQTVKINVALQSEFIEGETVVVIAERPAVKADVATSVTSLNAEDIEAIPMNSVVDVVALQAGVEDGLVIRGGGAEQTLFQVDGITLRDPRNNTPITNVPLSSLQEVSVERGGFNAEYGQVRSGIVKLVTKEGQKSNYYSNLIVQYSPPTRKYFGSSPFDQNSTMLKPYLDDDVAWTGTENGAWDKYKQKQYPSFVGWNEISRQLMSDSDPDNDLSPAAAQQLFRWQHRRKEKVDEPDYIIDGSFGGPVPFISEKLGNLRFFTSFRTEREMLLLPLSRPDYKDYFWSLKLNSDITPAIKLTLTSMIGKNFVIAQNEAGLDNSTQYIRSSNSIANQISNYGFSRATNSRLFSDSYFSAGNVRFNSFSAKLTHVLNSSTYYDVSLEYISRNYNVEPIGTRDFTENIEFVPGLFTNEAPFGFSSVDEPGVDGMLTGGHTSTARDFSAISGITMKFDFSSQINHYNLLKTGFDFVYSNLDLEYGEVKIQFPEGNTFVKKDHSPVRGAFYIQDKLELDGLIVNAGLRLDFSNANSKWVNVEPWDKSYFSSNYVEGTEFKTENAETILSLSPRLSISHPITENSKLFFNYGHFQQLPTYEQLFRLARGAGNDLRSLGDPNLKPEKTVSYELGYDHSIADDYLFQLAGFYRDINNQQDVAFYQSADQAINYFKANNNLYEDIRGFEMTLRKSRGNWWNGFLNYTYQVNTLGHFGRNEIYQDAREQNRYDKQASNQTQERPIPQPYARGNVTFFTPQDFGPKLADFYPLEKFSFNILADWREGTWLTWNPTKTPGISQNVQATDWYNIQLRFMKTFKFDPVKVTFMIDVNNALNTRRLSLNGFYDVSDFFAYYESLHLPKSNAYTNLVGDDRIGDFRDPGVKFQPIEAIGDILTIPENQISERAIYFDFATEKYMEFIDGTWSQVSKSRMNKIKDQKAYIDMPNHSYFNFLNPRQIFYGINISFSF